MERYHTVALKDKTNTVNCSNWELVKHGVPQGSILGPLFLITHKLFFIILLLFILHSMNHSTMHV